MLLVALTLIGQVTGMAVSHEAPGRKSAFRDAPGLEMKAWSCKFLNYQSIASRYRPDLSY